MRGIAIALVAVLTSPTFGLDLGAPMPMASHAMKDVDGRQWETGSVATTSGTLVIFMCVHCPWVQKWNQRIAELGELARQSGLGVIGVNSNDPARMTQDGPDGMRRQIEENGFNFPYVIDRGSVMARAYGAQRTPEAYLFDGRGMLVYRGTIDDNANDPAAVGDHFLRDAIGSVTAGRLPDPAETKALGCTIKMYPEG